MTSAPQSAIIIGKGTSILRTTASYIEGFDKIVIANRPVWDGYEKYLPKKAHIQYRNNSTQNFSAQEFIDLGIERVVSTALPPEKLPYEAHHGFVDVEYSKFQRDPNGTRNLFLEYVIDGVKRKINPSTGILAFYDIVHSGLFGRISLVGFDLVMTNERVYYFKPTEMQPNLQYLLDNGTYQREGFLNMKTNDHSVQTTGEFLYTLMMVNRHIQFEIMTDNTVFRDSLDNLDNVLVLEGEETK